jgi:1-acyl-sn-glycerol-3-phosphate acyltransferase
MMALGFASVSIPLRLLLRRELRDTPQDLQSQGWPIQLMEVLFLRYVIRWIDVRGIENLPEGSYLIASNHAWKSGVDGFLLGHLLATRADRVPHIVITGAGRTWTVSAERWVLNYYGIAMLAPTAAQSQAQHHGLTDKIAKYLRESNKHSVIIFPAGRAASDPAEQLKGWSTGVVVSAQKSGCPIVPVAIGGLPLNATVETVLISALHATDSNPPFRVTVRIGRPVNPDGDVQTVLDEVRSAVADLMAELPHVYAPQQPPPIASELETPTTKQA